MSIKCGSCKGRHETTAQVRLCYARKNGEATTERPDMIANGVIYEHKIMSDEEETRLIQKREREDDERAYAAKAARDEELEAAARLDSMTGRPGRDMASDKQVGYVMDLLNEREWPDALDEDAVRNMERRQVSKLIDQLKSAPLRPSMKSPIPDLDVPAGRYAVYLPHHVPERNADGSIVNSDISTGHMENKLVFIQVDRPTEGRWAGRTFVKQLIGAPGDYRKERMSSMREARVMTLIAADPEAASLRYGRESGVCGVCSSPLTNEDSLARGIGPVCAGKVGWGG